LKQVIELTSIYLNTQVYPILNTFLMPASYSLRDPRKCRSLGTRCGLYGYGDP